MKFLKYISTCLLMLSAAGCWGMQRLALQRPLVLSDMTIEHTKEPFDFGSDDINELIDVKYKDQDRVYKIGYLECSVINIQKPKHIVKKFTDRRLSCKDAKNNKGEVFELCEGCKKVIVIDYITINDHYQQQGLGRSFLGYFLKYVKDAYPQSIIFLMPMQKFAKNETNFHCSKEELQERLVNFYKSFGARYLKFSDVWMYISVKK